MFEQITNMIANFSDDRTKEYFLMSSPQPTLILIAAYLLTAKIILPAYMKDRPAYKVDKAIYYYNIFQVIWSCYIVYLAMNSVYLYFLAKFTEFPDTMFFVLRKKFNQVSFLHVYHHASMPVNVWLAVRLTPGGTMTMAVALNSSVHVVMYTYYLLAGLGPQWQKYLWWKRYLTAFQLIQFAFGLLQISLVLFGDCTSLRPYTPLFTFYLLYVASLLILFGKFYHDSYNSKLRKKDLNNNGVAKSKNNNKTI